MNKGKMGTDMNQGFYFIFHIHLEHFFLLENLSF